LSGFIGHERLEACRFQPAHELTLHSAPKSLYGLRGLIRESDKSREKTQMANVMIGKDARKEGRKVCAALIDFWVTTQYKLFAFHNSCFLPILE
jgi:hypothetical protein